jgi:hypothetical protein
VALDDLFLAGLKHGEGYELLALAQASFGSLLWKRVPLYTLFFVACSKRPLTTLTTRPILLVGTLIMRLRWWALLVRFKALWASILFRMSRSYRPALFVGLRFRFVQCFCFLVGGCYFSGSRASRLLGFLFTPFLPISAAFTPAFTQK